MLRVHVADQHGPHVAVVSGQVDEHVVRDRRQEEVRDPRGVSSKSSEAAEARSCRRADERARRRGRGR